MSATTDAAPPAPSPSNSGDVEDDSFIDVHIPGTAKASTSTTVLHDFSTCTTKFTGLLQGGGMVFTVNATTPTLIVSTSNAVLGTSLQEYVATNLYLLPKLHASNQLDQVSATDIEIIIEHGPNSSTSSSSSSSAATSGGGKNARYFLCAVVSAESALPDPDTVGTGKPAAKPAAQAAAPTTKLIGHDAALLAFLENIDTSSGASAQLKANNAKRLPHDTPLTFPGVGTCMSYPDSKGNTVLLTSAPLLASPALVAKLYTLVSASAPVFSNFDLVQAEGSAASLVTFRTNAPAITFDPVVSVLAAAEEEEEEGGEGGGDNGEGEAASSEGYRNNGKKRKRKKESADTDMPTGRLTPSQVLAVVVLVVVTALFAVPTWLFGPQLYKVTVNAIAGKDQNTTSGNSTADGIDAGIAKTKVILVFCYAVAAVFIGVGVSDAALYPLMLAGIMKAIVLIVFTLSIFFDVHKPNDASVIRGFGNVHPEWIKEVFRYHYNKDWNPDDVEPHWFTFPALKTAADWGYVSIPVILVTWLVVLSVYAFKK